MINKYVAVLAIWLLSAVTIIAALVITHDSRCLWAFIFSIIGTAYTIKNDEEGF